MKKDIVLFDLDGTLVNTIPAIANSFNYVLKEYGYKTYETLEYRNFIGNGIVMVFRKIKKLQNITVEEKEFIEKFRKHYEDNYLNGIKLYNNIDKVLDRLQELGIDIAIVTNKDNKLAIKHAETILSKWNFKYIYGAPENENYPIKPDPYIVNLISKNYDKDKMLFVGDMIVDINTAKNSGIDMIYCNYGYGKENEELDVIKINDAIEILKYIK